MSRSGPWTANASKAMAAIGNAGVPAILALPGEYPRTGEIESNEPSALLVLRLGESWIPNLQAGFPKLLNCREEMQSLHAIADSIYFPINGSLGSVSRDREFG